MKAALICHSDDLLNRQALPRWLASFTQLSGLVVIRETATQRRNRVRRELRRVGYFRFLDVLAFRMYHRLVLRAGDSETEHRILQRVSSVHPPLPDHLPILETAQVNNHETRDFLQRISPDILIARCKVILKPELFEIPRLGTYVMHPGICPEYRNAHGCFWALAERDLKNVGMTLLKIDKGVDTGPAYGYFSYPFDERNESHVAIQHRTVFDNLDAIRDKLLEIEKGIAAPLNTAGRKSGAWGQPWLTRYFRWKRAARKQSKQYEANIATLP